CYLLVNSQQEASLTLILAYQSATFVLGCLTLKSSIGNALAISGDVYWVEEGNPTYVLYR
ncbi:hypothetical protein AB7294_05295, partial [Cylindrospermopsis raciborskii UAM/DH-MRr]|uniref:hypothetical protein n=1 Tax=Cylindrospermopsis raciborskii TaxID=77022 RepID=UPI0038798CAC